MIRGNKSIRDRSAIFIVIILLSLYVFMVFFHLEYMVSYLPFASLAVILFFSLEYGLKGAAGAGFGSGLCSTLVIYFLGIGLNLIPWVLLTITGLAVGIYADMLAKEKRTMAETLERLQDENDDLSGRLAQFDNQFQAISESKLYDRSWDLIMNENPEAERIVGLMISELVESSRAVSIDLMKASSGMSAGTSYSYDYSRASIVPGEAGAYKMAMQGAALVSRCFEYLADINPEILAVMKPNGEITAYNHSLMALFGYTPEDKIAGLNIADFVMPSDEKRARANINRALLGSVNPGEQYRIKTKDGRNIGKFVPENMTFKCKGNPVTLVACVDRETSLLVARKKILCTSPEGKITYSSTEAAGMLGDRLAGKGIGKIMDKKNFEAFKDLEECCMDGNKHTSDIELLDRNGKTVIVHVEALPLKSSMGHYLGLIMFMEDITEIRRVEQALQHRFSMEEMITAISTRFIDLGLEELDSEITKVLKIIGDFKGADRSFVSIFASDRIGKEKQYEVLNVIPQMDSNDSNAYNLETIMIPIVIDTVSVGFFRFNQKRFSEVWLEEDIKLIRLVGEIIFNALSRKRNEAMLKISEDRLRITLHSIGDAMITTDIESKVVMMNKVAEELTGWSLSEALEKPLGCVLDISFDYNEENAIQMKSKEGEERYISLTRNRIEDEGGQIFGEVIVFRDITEQKRRDDEIKYISFHDKLTGLYNRAFFEEEIKRLDTARQYPITMILGDVNGLKIANDVFGHLEGDRLLQTVASILKQCARREDIVARWGGDEFAIIMPRTDDKAAAIIRERITNACLAAEKAPIQPGLALGSATKTEEGQDIAWLLKMAEDRMYRHKLLEGKGARSAILLSLENMIYEKSYETEEHTKRLVDLSSRVGLAIGLSDDELNDLSLLSALHDIGKVGIPDSILMKPGKLSAEEWIQMKKHPEKGYKIASAAQDLSNIAELILFHHEKWDGSGYPKGLKGEEIPKLSRLLSIVDAYDVITHPRVYKGALSHEEAIEEIRRCRGSHFDPDLADVFIRMMKKVM